VIWQVEIDIEALQRAALLPLELIDVEGGKHLAAYFMLHMRQRQEPLRQEVPVAYLRWGQRRQLVPAHLSG
jgi:hypothetical protein